MKKIILLLLVMSMLMGLLAACGGSETTAPSQATPGSTGSTAGTTAPTQPSQPQPSQPSDDPWASYETITIAEALAMTLADGEVTTERYYIRGTVAEMLNAAYGEMTLTDETGSIYVYGTYSEDGSLKYSEMEEKAFKGDEVLLHCTLKNFKGTIEINNARLIDFVAAQVEIDPTGYTEMTIEEARNAAQDTKVKVSGVVAQITYANGMIPSGVILVDNTNAIYVYDRDLAARVKTGNQITVLASKTYWVLDSEKTNADKYGYKGCNQLEAAILAENDEGNHDFDKNWITTSTVQDVMNTPVTQDITTTIFKVTAQVKRVDGNGFINYYINDLDGKTGSYAYTQCSGSDFAWLDAFDGKICTVYLTVLNAKSTASGCVWRFLPVAVEDEGFDPASVNFAENAVKLFAMPQFLAKYTGDPAQALMTTVDNELLGYTGVKLSYSSDNTSAVYFDGNVMHCGVTGVANVTITGTYGDQTFSATVTIAVEIAQQSVSYITVDQAVNTAIGEKVVVKGIVGPSLVNQDGFYLIDETGIIAVLTDTETLATLEIGYEVILEGERFFKSKSGGNWGNTCIRDAKVVVNNYGSHDYSTNSFDGVLTLAEFAALDPNVDYTTYVFTVTATIEVVETAYYTNIKLVDGDVSVNLYCSSAKQYKWLTEFAGQTVTLELAPCNWSSKSSYPACALAVILPDGTKIVNNLNFQD